MIFVIKYFWREIILLVSSKKRQFFLLFILGIFSLFLACLSTNYDYDLFARLIVGERFIEQGILPFKDFLSYTLKLLT